MKRLIISGLILCSIFSWGAASAHGGSSFIFVTAEQTVSPGALSKVMTMQFQNGDHKEEPISETIDLDFKSTSPTGEFLGSTGKPASKTMSKNTSNRSFYYKDSTEGEYKITVVATGRTSNNSYTVTQPITVGEAKPVVVPKPTATKPNTLPGVPTVETVGVHVQAEVEASSTVSVSSFTDVFVAESRPSLLSRIFAWPIRISDFFIHLFYEV